MENKIIPFFGSTLILFLLFHTFSSFSQSSGDTDTDFIFYLVNKGDFKEALYLLDRDNNDFILSSDTANYLRGWSLYSLKHLLPSAESLKKVKPESEFYPKSHFFAAYNYAHLGYYDDAVSTLEGLQLFTEKQNAIRNLQLSGIYLLQNDSSLFKEYYSKTNGNFFELANSYKNIGQLSNDYFRHKAKSPVIAGLVSGIIPGSGKFYSGKKGEAISSFIATCGLGLVTFENYKRSGLKNYKTILFGTAFAFSYAANIYGAVLSVNIAESEYNENIKNTILFNLHIPLRNSFDK